MTTDPSDAARIAAALDAVPETGADPELIESAAAALRSQHARIAALESEVATLQERVQEVGAAARQEHVRRAELEAQLEAIGAGGFGSSGT